jgi:hypothetical protein
MDDIDSTGRNTERYKKMFKDMSGKQFEEFIISLGNKDTQLSVMMPNIDSTMTTDGAIALAKKRNVKIFDKVVFADMTTGRKYSTEYDMLILTLPIRRLSQYLFHKISLPESDTHINSVSGQVIPPDKGAAISAIETQMLASKGLETSILELIKVRAGDINAYKAMKYQIEESGEVSMANIPLTGRPRSAIVVQMYLHAMGIDSNL